MSMNVNNSLEEVYWWFTIELDGYIQHHSIAACPGCGLFFIRDIDDEIESIFVQFTKNAMQGQPASIWQGRIRIQSCLKRTGLTKPGFSSVREPSATSMLE